MTRLSRRNIVAGVLALIVAAGCVRLGIWQLQRLGERRSLNAAVRARMLAAPVAVAELPADTALAHYRRVLVEGVWDFEREIVLAGRTRQGAPGVNILTPVRPAGEGRAVLVSRGWVYSPNGASVDLTRWREGADARVTGYVESFPAAQPGDPRLAVERRAWRRLDAAELARTLPYPIAPYYVVMVADSGGGDVSLPGVAPGDGGAATGAGGDGRGGVPVRAPLPALSEGSHWSYAIQWFSFAAIALGGVATLIWRDGRSQAGHPARRE